MLHDRVLEVASIRYVAVERHRRDPEPLPDGHPLWELGNVLVTPHVATPPATERIAFAARVRENVRRFAAGEELEGLIDADGGY